MAINGFSIGGQISKLAEALWGDQVAVSGQGDFTPSVDAPNNPMQAVVDQVIARSHATGDPVTLDAIVQAGQDAGLSVQHIANLQHVQMGAVQFTDTGLDALKQMNNGQNININIAGADISGSTFHPESSFEGIIVDEVTPTGQVVAGPDTTMQFMNFKDFSQQADIELQGDVSFLTISGTREQGAKQPNIRFADDTVARGVNMQDARLATLEVGAGADLTGLEASGASALRTDAVDATLDGADFSGASFGFNSRMTNSSLIAANFEGAVMADLDLRGSNLVGSNFKGADLSTVKLEGARIDPESLIGARYEIDGVSSAIDNEEVAIAFMHSRGMERAGGNVTLEVAAVENELHAIEAQREAGPTPYHPAMATTVAQVAPEEAVSLPATPGTDALIASLEACMSNKVTPAASHEFDPSANCSLDQHRVEHPTLDRAMT